jgi:Fur family zinc uptake transcriptional regulator
MSTSPPLGFSLHDHAHCVSGALAQAEAVCKNKGLQFTKSRRRVLEILLSEHKAMGAYDILGKLSEEGVAAQPPVAYRALDFLVSHGFAHKVEKLSAYIACSLPGADHDPAFLICRTCETVAEQPQVASMVGSTGFQVESSVVEAEGLCPDCQKEKS